MWTHQLWAPLPKALEILEINSQSSVLQAHIKKNINKRRGDVKACQSNSATKTRHFSPLSSLLNWPKKEAGIRYKVRRCQFLGKCFSLTYGNLQGSAKLLFDEERQASLLRIPFWMLKWNRCSYYSIIFKSICTVPTPRSSSSTLKIEKNIGKPHVFPSLPPSTKI